MEATHNREMTGGEATVAALLAGGIRSLYCLPGVQNDHLFNALHDSGAIAAIHARHEQGAAYMALGAAMATGRPSAYSVVPGPGFLNASAALSTAYAVNAPVLCLAGQIPSPAIGRGFGLLHELPDQSAILRQLTKWSARAGSPAEIPALGARAFAAATSGRPRPVGLEVPPDVLAMRAAVPPPEPLAPAAAKEPDEAALDAALRLLREARFPLIFVGSGALAVGAEVLALAERLGAPVVANRLGRGILDDRHPLSHTLPGGHAMWRDCDLVLSVGSRLQIPLQVWGRDSGLKVVRIDVDAEELARFGGADVAIEADVGVTLARLLTRLEPNPLAAERRLASATVKAKLAAGLATLQPQIGYLQAIRDVLPDDGVLVDELTQVGYVARVAYEARRPRTLLASGYQGTLGWGVPTALGARHALGERPVVSISGDGGFMFNASELATAVRHGIGAVFVVFNDNAYGNVRRLQRDAHGGRLIASDLCNPDFVRFAESFGVDACRASDPAALRSALETAIASGRPWLIEVPIGDVPTPWRYINMPKLRG